MDNMTQYKDYKKFKQDFETEIFNYAEANCYESDDFDKCFDFYQDYHGLEDCYIKVRIKAQEEIDRYKEALAISHINWRTENLEVEKLKKEISQFKEEIDKLNNKTKNIETNRMFWVNKASQLKEELKKERFIVDKFCDLKPIGEAIRCYGSDGCKNFIWEFNQYSIDKAREIQKQRKINL